MFNILKILETEIIKCLKKEVSLRLPCSDDVNVTFNEKNTF